MREFYNTINDPYSIYYRIYNRMNVYYNFTTEFLCTFYLFSSTKIKGWTYRRNALLQTLWQSKTLEFLQIRARDEEKKRAKQQTVISPLVEDSHPNKQIGKLLAGTNWTAKYGLLPQNLLFLLFTSNLC